MPLVRMLILTLVNKMATYKNLNFTIDQSEKQLF